MRNKFKRILSTLIVVGILASMFSIGAMAATSDIWTYTVNGDGTTCTITGCSQTSGNIVIPSSISGFTVTQISTSGASSNIFGSTNNTTVTSVSIPNTVKIIEAYAFSGCSNITSVVIPIGVTKIGSSSFKNTGISTCVIPNSVNTIGSYAFVHTQITSISIPSSVTSLGANVFASCFELRTATVSANITTLSDQLFYNCQLLAMVTITSSITSIGTSTFDGCYKLETVNYPNTLISIGNNAFNACPLLTISLNTNISTIRSGAFTGVPHVNYRSSVPNQVTAANTYNAIVAGSWVAVADTSTVNTQELSAEGTDSTSPIIVAADPINFKATVPLTLPAYIDSTGAATTATNATVKNASPCGYIRVKGITVSGSNGWALEDSSNIPSKKFGTKCFSLSVNGNNADAGNGAVSTAGQTSIAAGSTTTITYSLKVPAQKSVLTDTAIANVVIVIGWN